MPDATVITRDNHLRYWQYLVVSGRLDADDCLRPTVARRAVVTAEIALAKRRTRTLDVWPTRAYVGGREVIDLFGADVSGTTLRAVMDCAVEDYRRHGYAVRDHRDLPPIT